MVQSVQMPYFSWAILEARAVLQRAGGPRHGANRGWNQEELKYGDMKNKHGL